MQGGKTNTLERNKLFTFTRIYREKKEVEVQHPRSGES